MRFPRSLRVPPLPPLGGDIFTVRRNQLRQSQDISNQEELKLRLRRRVTRPGMRIEACVFSIQGLGCGVQGVGFKQATRLEACLFTIQSLGCGVQCVGFKRTIRLDSRRTPRRRLVDHKKWQTLTVSIVNFGGRLISFLFITLEPRVG